MAHLHHLTTHKALLEKRSQIIRAVRDFFWKQDFLEVETPTILRLPGQEPYLSPMKLDVHDQTGKPYTGYLHTSPEYTMKKYLAVGFDKIFYLGKVFRDQESFGGLHNPEFTMIEWYRSNANFYAIMDDCEHLISTLQHFSTSTLQHMSIAKVHMRELWKEYVHVNLDEYLTRESMYSLCVQKGYATDQSESYEDVFYRIFLNEIEPRLVDRGALFIHHYPAPMAALSKLSKRFPGYAERVELYVHGIEIANGFTELTDADEQLWRLHQEQNLRKQSGKDVFDIDIDFIEAVGNMPASAGIALGIDRFIMILLGCKNIEEVIGLSATELFT